MTHSWLAILLIHIGFNILNPFHLWRLEDDLRLAVSAQKSAEKDAEVRKNTVKELETNVVQLQLDLEKASEKKTQLLQVMIYRLIIYRGQICLNNAYGKW